MPTKYDCLCGGTLTAIYERESATADGKVRTYCPKCGRQGPSKTDWQSAVKAWYDKHGGTQ